jgi:hypothetical protein
VATFVHLKQPFRINFYSHAMLDISVTEGLLLLYGFKVDVKKNIFVL